MKHLTPREEIWRGLLYGQRSMMLRLAATLKSDFALSVAQFEALLSLLEAGAAVPMSRLGRSLLYSSGSTTHLVARLAERGLLARTADAEDARIVLVDLTPEGRELITAALAQHTEEIGQAFAPLIDDAEVEVLLGFARRLAAHEGVTSQPGSWGTE